MLELVGGTIGSWCRRTDGAIQVAELLRHGVGAQVGIELCCRGKLVS